jgi:L-malate glycosyltransferase
MQVAVCSTGVPYGGKEQFIYTFAEYLKRKTQIKVMVILFSKGVLYEKLLEANIETEVVAPQFKYDLFVVGKIGKILKEKKIQIVHTHGYKANLLCGIAAKLQGLKVVKTEHGALEPLGTLWERIKIQINLFCDHALSKVLVDQAVFVSKDLQRRNVGHYGNVLGRVIYNGIPPFHLNGAVSSADFEPQFFHVGIIGRLTPVKGHAVLLDAVAGLETLQLRLHIFGDGALAEELKRSCRQKGIDSLVIFHGFKQNIPEYMSRLQLLVMPSLHEGFPYTLLEAGYLKIPFVATAVGGIREVFEDQKDCLLVAPSDAAALQAAICDLYQDAEKRKRLAESAHKKVTEHFLLEHMIEQYLEVYEN